MTVGASAVAGFRTVSTMIFILAAAAPASAAELTLETLQKNLDLVWTLLAASLVLMMQLGFLLLEAGMVRSKNSINVAQKNLLDFAVSVIAFSAVGFMIAFASGNGWPFGIDGDFLFLGSLDTWHVGFFVFQVMFCGTAATIVSGAVAERMRLVSYLLCAAVVAGVIYPVFVHWAWGNAVTPNSSAFLANMGFVDFAGSTVVHATGGWVALAACIVLGPRLGRFDSAGKPIRIAGHSPVLAAAGAFVLFVGWIGFNGGSTIGVKPAIAHIIANTVLAAGTGGLAGYVVGWYKDGVVLPEQTLSGMLGGLVAVTAGCMVLDPFGALAIGLIGGLAAIWGNSLLENELGIDDAVGAIGVHGFAGMAGTIGLALLAPLENLPLASRWDQLQVQVTAVTVNFFWTFGTGYAFFWTLNRYFPIRVTREAELIGLNEAEHGTRMGVVHVERALQTLVSGNADLNMRLELKPGDESETLTRLFNDLMENIQAEEAARARAKSMMRDAEEAERLSALAAATFEAIWILQDGRIVDGNVKLEELLGEPIATLRGRPVIELFAPQHRASVREAMLKPVADPYEAEIVMADGTSIPMELRGREILYRGEPSRIGCLVDLRERKNAEARIRHLALHDPLTGLPNRALFNERLASMAKRASDANGQGAVVLIDLDRFKDINDIYGHPAGDLVIKTSADRILALAGNDGVTVARLGGDEFAVLMSGLAFGNLAADFAFRVVTQLIQPITLEDGRPVRVGASVGVALCPRDGNDPALLVSRADTALYHAKNTGRNNYCLFEPGMDAFLGKRKLLETDLGLALERDEFELHFQPRVSVDQSRIVSYEALVRWRHPERGLVSPADFIPIAEQGGKIVAIGDWVLRTACLAARNEFGAARVSVNVSPVQFRQKSFVESVAAILEETGLAPGRLEIEITEGVLIDDDNRAGLILKQLKQLGITIALDDFGTGYSSLGYLSRFPFDTIKIDRSFVRELTSSENARAIINTIVGLGCGLRMKVVAEGVETVEEAAILAMSGCNELQGFLLGRPLPVGEMSADADQEVASIIAQARDMQPEMANRLRSIAQDMSTRSGETPIRKMG